MDKADEGGQETGRAARGDPAGLEEWRGRPAEAPRPQATRVTPVGPWDTPPMTRLERVRDKALIPAVFRDPRRIDKALTLLVTPGTKPDLDSGYWKKAKKQLKAESGGKCAYCE